MGIVVAGLWLDPGSLYAGWVDPFAAPPLGTYQITPITAGSTNQTKPASLGVGGNFFVGSTGGTAQACINGTCYQDLLDALANATNVHYLRINAAGPLSPADVGPVRILGNVTAYHFSANNCIGTPCGPAQNEPVSGTDLDIVDYTIHRSQPPLDLTVNYIENYTCYTSPSTFCYTNATCSSLLVCSNSFQTACVTSAVCPPGGSCNVSSCGFRTVCQNNPTVYCPIPTTSSSTCGGNPCVIQGMIGNTFDLTITMSDGSKRVVTNIFGSGGAVKSTIPGATSNDAQYLSVDVSTAAVGGANSQSLQKIKLDNTGSTSITMTRLQATWYPPAGTPPSKIRSVIIGGTPDSLFEPSAFPTVAVTKLVNASATTNVFKAVGNSAVASYPSHGVFARHYEIGGAAVLGQSSDFRCSKASAIRCAVNNDCIIGSFNFGNCVDPKFYVGKQQCFNDITKACSSNADCGGNACLTIPAAASAGEFHGPVSLDTSSGQLYLFSKDTSTGGSQTVITPANIYLLGDLKLANAAGLSELCLYGTGAQECINEWIDVGALHPPTSSSRWTASSKYLTYLKRTAGKLNIGGTEGAKDSEFVFNQTASKLVSGLVVDPGASLRSAQFKLTCGDGACNGVEACGLNDVYPTCNTDCGVCTGDTTPPTAPPNFREYDVVTNFTVHLAWDASTDNVGVAGYRIYRCHTAGCTPSASGVIYDGPANILTHDDTVATSRTPYRYLAVAYDGAGNVSPTSATLIEETVSQTGGGGGCFLAGSPVRLADGSEKSIESIKVGDVVLGYNEYTGKNEYNTVTQTFAKGQEGYILINKKLKVSPPHLFYAEGRWIDASKLHVGDSLRMENGQTSRIWSLQNFSGIHTVYNLEVESDHTYMVGGFVVHNKVIPFGNN